MNFYPRSTKVQSALPTVLAPFSSCLPSSQCDCNCDALSHSPTSQWSISQGNSHQAISLLWGLCCICHCPLASFWDALVACCLHFRDYPDSLYASVWLLCFLLGLLSSICHLNVDVPQGFGCASSCLASPCSWLFSKLQTSSCICELYNTFQQPLLFSD